MVTLQQPSRVLAASLPEESTNTTNSRIRGVLLDGQVALVDQCHFTHRSIPLTPKKLPGNPAHLARLFPRGALPPTQMAASRRDPWDSRLPARAKAERPTWHSKPGKYRSHVVAQIRFQFTSIHPCQVQPEKPEYGGRLHIWEGDGYHYVCIIIHSALRSPEAIIASASRHTPSPGPRRSGRGRGPGGRAWWGRSLAANCAGCARARGRSPRAGGRACRHRRPWRERP